MSPLAELRAGLRAIESVVVAFSGGADSAFLAWVATDTLGAAQVRCVTAVSPSLARVERDHCAELAAAWELNWQEVETDEMDRAAYQVNDAMRCHHCKDALMDALVPVAEDATIVLGVNTDDLGDHRPGQHAAAARGARFPLVEAGFSKADVRAWSRRLGLVTWDKPAAPCLASRLPYGTSVTLGRLAQVERAEATLRALGYADVRVRHYGARARVEIAAAELGRATAAQTEIVAALRRCGYRDVVIDPAGLRSGNLNDALTTTRSPAAP
jgi:uncharacterized protein